MAHSGVSANATIDGDGPVSETAATMDGSMAALSPSVTIEGRAALDRLERFDGRRGSLRRAERRQQDNETLNTHDRQPRSLA